MLDCQLTGFSVQGGHLLNSPQTRQSLLNHQFLFDFLGEEVQEFQGICDVVGLGHLELVLDSGIEQGSLHFPSILGKPPSQMSFKQVKDITEATISETILLFFVPAIHNGTDKIISFLPLDHIIQNLIVIGPHEIPNRKVAGPHLHPVFLAHFLLEERLVLLVLDLSCIDQQFELDVIFIVDLSFRQFGDYWGHRFASFAVSSHEGA